MDRREFLKLLGRISVIGGVSILAGKLFFLNGEKSIKKCINDSLCTSCTVVNKCKLPRALSYKNNSERI
jgi:hypothetical protein